MDIISELKNETDIEKLREKALKHLQIMYNAMVNASYRVEVFEFLLGTADLDCDFEYCANPEVSIIIPVRNEFVMTSALLHSIKKNIHNIKYEIIIADDNSTDETADIENIFRGVTRIVNNTGHTGFLYNVKSAAAKARGEYIFLMNNDMIVTPGCLEELLKVIKSSSDIGIAGSKTLRTDGCVDECGVKMNVNGKVVFLGEDEPEDYADDKDYIDCDYCSGCSVLFKKETWEKSGGFDVNYAPAYYEDSDFAYNLKYNYGLKSVCVPKSKIYHFKSMSYRRYPIEDENFVRNKARFREKWGKYLGDLS